MNVERRTASGPLSGLLLCADATVPTEVLSRAMSAAGVEVVAVVSRWHDAVECLATTAVDVVVADLALAGALGLRLVSMLQAVAPQAQVILVSPWPDIDVAALRVGATVVVHPTDLRPLGVALRRISVALARS